MRFDSELFSFEIEEVVVYVFTVLIFSVLFMGTAGYLDLENKKLELQKVNITAKP